MEAPNDLNFNLCQDEMEVFHSGKYDEALRMFESAALERPYSVEILFGKALCLRFVERLEDALEVYATIRERKDANSFVIRYELCLAEADCYNYFGATCVELFSKALTLIEGFENEKNVDKAELLWMKASIFRHAGDFDTATKILREIKMERDHRNYSEYLREMAWTSGSVHDYLNCYERTYGEYGNNHPVMIKCKEEVEQIKKKYDEHVSYSATPEGSRSRFAPRQNPRPPGMAFVESRYSSVSAYLNHIAEQLKDASGKESATKKSESNKKSATRLFSVVDAPRLADLWNMVYPKILKGSMNFAIGGDIRQKVFVVSSERIFRNLLGTTIDKRQCWINLYEDSVLSFLMEQEKLSVDCDHPSLACWLARGRCSNSKCNGNESLVGAHICFDDASIHHIIPLCKACNNAKSDALLTLRAGTVVLSISPLLDLDETGFQALKKSIDRLEAEANMGRTLEGLKDLAAKKATSLAERGVGSKLKTVPKNHIQANDNNRVPAPRAEAPQRGGSRGRGSFERCRNANNPRRNTGECGKIRPRRVLWFCPLGPNDDEHNIASCDGAHGWIGGLCCCSEVRFYEEDRPVGWCRLCGERAWLCRDCKRSCPDCGFQYLCRNHEGHHYCKRN
jgi:tetratricopeptide (TPR) repeat protein